MAIDFSDATGNLFNRLGKLGKVIQQQDSYQNTQESNLIDVSTGLVAQYDAEADVQAIVGDNYISLLDSGASTFGGFAQNLAAATLNRVVFRDNPQLRQTLTSADILTSLQELIRQMKAQGQSVLAMTVAGTPGVFIGTGNGVVVFSAKRALDGLVLENTLAENVKVTCSSDSYTGGATVSNETLQVTGTGRISNVFSFQWPAGSDGSISISAIDGGADDTNGNLLTNSDFDTWTSNVPDKWTLSAGTAGVDVIEESSITFDTSSNKSLKLVGDGTSNNFWLRQLFDSSTGTLGELEPDTQYACNLWCRCDGTTPGAGVIRGQLCYANGTVIKDNNGVDNSFDIDLTTLSGTTWKAFNGSFRTPHIMPSAYYLDLRLTTGLTSARSVYLDRVGLGEMSQLYVSGPSFACFSGSIPFVFGDYATVAVTNSRGAAGTLTTWQTLFSRLFPQMLSNELLLPSSAVPTISDARIS